MSLSLPASPPRAERLHGLDALRGFALLLGVALHARWPVCRAAQYFWLITDTDSSVACSEPGFYWIHSVPHDHVLPARRVTSGACCSSAAGPRASSATGEARRRCRWSPSGRWCCTGIVIAVMWLARGSRAAAAAAGARAGPDVHARRFPAHAPVVPVPAVAGSTPRRQRCARCCATLDPRGRIGRRVDAVLRVARPWAALLLALPVAVALCPAHELVRLVRRADAGSVAVSESRRRWSASASRSRSAGCCSASADCWHASRRHRVRESGPGRGGHRAVPVADRRALARHAALQDLRITRSTPRSMASPAGRGRWR